jgi:hypothetical protein
MPEFFCIPTANPEKCGATFAKWKAMGYLTAALTDGDTVRPGNCDVWLHVLDYRGWAWATNLLVRHVLELSPETPFVVCGGDDMDPDPNVRAEVIAAQCAEHFGGSLGVMQPTGDRWAPDESGRVAAERICGSPWLGREWVQRAYGGRGPWHEEYGHFFVDEELYEITKAMGLLWQRPDLTHLHHHWHRTGEQRPKYMEKAAERWAQDEATFRRRKLAGFAGAELRAA